MKKKFTVVLVGTLTLILSGCQKQPEEIPNSYSEEAESEVIEEHCVESGNNIDTSRLLDECENIKVHWESDSIDVDGNGITDYVIVGTVNEENKYRNILGVMLDDGKIAVSEFQGVTGWREDFITVRTDKLRYTDKDSIVIQFTESTSN